MQTDAATVASLGRYLLVSAVLSVNWPVCGGSRLQEVLILWVRTSTSGLGSGLRGTERKWLRLMGWVWLWARQGRLRRDGFRLFSFRISLMLVCMPEEERKSGSVFSVVTLKINKEKKAKLYSGMNLYHVCLYWWIKCILARDTCIKWWIGLGSALWCISAGRTHYPAHTWR